VPEIRQQASQLAEHLTSAFGPNMLEPNVLGSQSKETDGEHLRLALDNLRPLPEPAKK
jgi:hypothetical protein